MNVSLPARLLIGLLLLTPLHAEDEKKPAPKPKRGVLVELFTSQG